jgi:tetratricopeptide (TPR) repeat protein
MKRTGLKLGLDDRTLVALKAAGVNFTRLDPGISPEKTLGARDEKYFQHINEAQDLLAKGRYFDAEDRFTRAIATAPGDPLAAVGRIHAQLGAGMYISAATNLRRVFADNPELIAATFASTLVPTPERALQIKARLRDELLKAAEKATLGRDAALLLAYLGHITADQRAMREGVTEFRNRTPEDDDADLALGELLERLWFDTPTPAPAPAPVPAPAVEPAPASPEPAPRPPVIDIPANPAPAPAPDRAPRPPAIDLPPR